MARPPQNLNFNLADWHRKLGPPCPLIPAFEFEPWIVLSERYLASDEALRSLDADSYWPKWNSPWWHMLLLHEMREAKRIPERAIHKMVEVLNALPLKIFPIHPGEMPIEADPYRHSSCHCALGCIYQVLSAWGLNVDQELPWSKPWFFRYQMLDGGLNCDNEAYLQKDEVPSSMVGTIAPFMAILNQPMARWTADEIAFLDRAAGFLIKRQLMHGSSTHHNAAERASSEDWLKLCFPRFYFYDVLHGLNALLRWSELRQTKLPLNAILPAIQHLNDQFPEGLVRLQRQSFAGTGTILHSATGEWLRRQPASLFPLLEKTSGVGTISPFLTRQWEETRATVGRLIEVGLLRE